MRTTRSSSATGGPRPTATTTASGTSQGSDSLARRGRRSPRHRSGQPGTGSAVTGTEPPGGDFEDVVRSHEAMLRAHCYRMLGSPEDADDALQETMLAAWRGRSGFRGDSSVRTWLYRIATNCCLRLAEKRGPRTLSWDHGPSLDPHADLG